MSSIFNERMIKSENNNKNPIQKLYHLYLSGLSVSDFELLVKREAPGIYQFYKEQIQPPDPSLNKFLRALIFIKDLFIVFLLKLTPVRRLVYTGALFFFFWGLMYDSGHYLFLGFLTLNFLLAFELADKLSVKDELEVAKKIQNGLMPDAPPILSAFDVSCFIAAAREVGGDYYDFIKVNSNGNYLFVIGDISGKGMAAALNMIQVRTLIHVLSSKEEEMAVLLKDLNSELCRIFKRDYFFTANVALIGEDNTIAICRAGHLPVIHYRYSDKSVCIHKPKGIGLGLSNGNIFSDTLEVTEVKPERGDILLFYTDGVNECMDETGEMFGDERLKIVLKKYAHLPVDKIREAIVEHIFDFSSEVPQHDDITFTLFKVR